MLNTYNPLGFVLGSGVKVPALTDYIMLVDATRVAQTISMIGIQEKNS